MLPRPDYYEIDRKALKTPTYDLTQYVKKWVKIDDFIRRARVVKRSGGTR
jgi:hypothetical protein